MVMTEGFLAQKRAERKKKFELPPPRSAPFTRAVVAGKLVHFSALSTW